jgi:hypothetical protein
LLDVFYVVEAKKTNLLDRRPTPRTADWQPLKDDIAAPVTIFDANDVQESLAREWLNPPAPGGFDQERPTVGDRVKSVTCQPP